MKTAQELMSSALPAEFAGIMLRFLSFLRRHRIHTTLNLANSPNVDVLCVALDVEKRAATDGRNNLPSSSEISITGSQKGIVDFHRKLQARARSKIEKLAVRLNAAARRVDPSETINRLRDIPSKCQIRIDRILAELETKDALPRQQKGSEQQQPSDSDEQCKEAESRGFASNAVFFMMMLAATGMTALALGSDLVWGANAGSLLDSDPAFAIAVMAVVVPYLVAVSVSAPSSMLLYRERPAFLIAIVLILAYLGLLAFFCAHLIVISADAPAFAATHVIAAVSAMISDPGVISANFDALKGFGVVTMMGLLVFLLGNQAVTKDNADDGIRAANFGSGKHRQKNAERLRRRINSIVDAAEKEIDGSVKLLQKRFKKLSRLSERASESQVLYDDFLARLEESCNILLERYREINTAERSIDVPPSFTEQICFRMEGASRVLFFENGLERHQKTEDEMKGLYDAVAEIRRNLWDLNRVALRNFDVAEMYQDEKELVPSS